MPEGEASEVPQNEHTRIPKSTEIITDPVHLNILLATGVRTANSLRPEELEALISTFGDKYLTELNPGGFHL